MKTLLRKRPRNKGIAVLLTSVMLVAVMGIVGMAVDVGLMYAIKTKLSAAADAAALAGARAIGRGGAGGTLATDTATAYFNANMPAGYLFATNISATPVLTNSAAHVQTLTVTGQATLPLLFWRFFNATTLIQAVGAASRRDTNLVLVLDRSGSMTTSGSCAPMVAAAQDFTDQFEDGRDNLGLVVFGGSYSKAYNLSTTFKSGGPTISSVIGTITCGGNTGSAQAIWQAYQMLATLNQPGALNVIVFFTDGQPNGLSADWPIAKSVTPVYPNSSGSSSGTPTATATTPWFLGYPVSGCAAASITGVIARNGEQQHGIFGNVAPSIGADAGTVSASGCAFASNQNRVHEDVSFIPPTDTYGNKTTGYWDATVQHIPAGPFSGKVMLDHYATGTCAGNPCGLFDNNIDLASMNAAEDAANRARNDPNIGVTIFAIGLGGAADASPGAFLDHVSNDQNSDTHNSNQPTGSYIYVTGSGQLGGAFQQVAGFILRLSL